MKALVTLFISCLTVAGQTNPSTHSQTSQASMGHLYNAYWTTAQGTSSFAQIHNNSVSQPLVVEPVLFTANGSQLNLSTRTLTPLGNATIDIASELNGLGWRGMQSGSAIFQYRGAASGALTAEIYVENIKDSVSFTIPSSDGPPASKTQNAVFWVPSRDAEVYVAIQNVTSSAIHVSPRVTIGSAALPLDRVTLPPYGSATLSISKSSLPHPSTLWAEHAVGGIILTQDGPDGALNTGGWIEDDKLGYSTTITFADPTGKGNSLMTTQILVGSAAEALNIPGPFVVSSQLVVMNTSSQPVQFEGQLTFSDNTGAIATASISPTSIVGGSVQRIDLGQVKAQAGVSASFSEASLTLKYTGTGSIMARVFGASDDLAYGFYWALQSSAAHSYAESFWTTANNWTPVLTVGNFASIPDSIHLQLTSNAGTFSVPVFNLQPNESRTLNIRDLINSEKPFASDVNFGGYRIWGASNQSRLVVKEHLLNLTSKLATPFYGTYIYALAFYPDSASYTGYVGGDTMGFFLDIDYSDSSTGSGCPYAYGSDNTSVATVALNGCVGVVTPVDAGTANISANQSLVSDSAGDYSDWQSSPPAPAKILAPGHVVGSGSYYSDCSGQYGFKIDIAYQLFDNGSPISNTYPVNGLQCYEKITNWYVNGSHIPDHDWDSTCGVTNSSGVFHDVPYGACNSTTMTMTGTQQMKFIINGKDYIVRTNNFTFSGTGVGTGTMSNGNDVSINH